MKPVRAGLLQSDLSCPPVSCRMTLLHWACQNLTLVPVGEGDDGLSSVTVCRPFVHKANFPVKWLAVKMDSSSGCRRTDSAACTVSHL